MTNSSDIFTIEDEKTKVISLNQLSSSIRIEGKYGDKLATKPVQIWRLITKLQEILSNTGLNYTLDNIYVQKRSSAAFLNDQEKDLGYDKYNAPINRWRFDKAITAIKVNNIKNSEGNPSIAITLNEDGLVVAYGMNVSICSNFSIMGANTILRTYKFSDTPGMPWELMKMKIEKWTTEIEPIFALQTEVMENMKNTEIKDITVTDRVIGDLYQKAILQAYFKGDATPFDTHSLSQFVQESLKQRRQEERFGTIENVWDLYNWGTSVMKPSLIDIGEIANNSHLFSNYLCNEFGIPVPVYDAEEV